MIANPSYRNLVNQADKDFKAIGQEAKQRAGLDG